MIFKINFFEKLFKNYHQSVKQFVPIDQARCYNIQPDLSTNCLQKLSEDDAVGKELTVLGLAGMLIFAFDKVIFQIIKREKNSYFSQLKL